MPDFRQKILDYVKTFSGLPTLNTISRKFTAVLGEEELSLPRLSEIVRYDPGLSSRIISVANSAWYNRGVPISGLERAIVTLGSEEVKNIITCALFYDSILKGLGLKKKYIFELWEHSLLVAFTTKAVSSPDDEEGEKAFVSGLFHDIGKVPLQLLYRQDFSDPKSTMETVCEIEQAKYNIDHTQIGAAMALEWKLPDEYRQAILLHHSERDRTALSSAVRKSHLIMFEETEDEEILALRQSVQVEAQKTMTIFSG
jgi:putative nucleotidyltransferase with HDIG domain